MIASASSLPTSGGLGAFALELRSGRVGLLLSEEACAALLRGRVYLLLLQLVTHQLPLDCSAPSANPVFLQQPRHQLTPTSVSTTTPLAPRAPRTSLFTFEGSPTPPTLCELEDNS